MAETYNLNTQNIFLDGIKDLATVGQPIYTGRLSSAHKNRSCLLNILAFEFTNRCGEAICVRPLSFQT
jgi:hypothetical protein